MQDAFVRREATTRLDTACSALQLSDPFDRRSRLICDRAALTGSADAASLPVGAAASVGDFPGWRPFYSGL